MRKPTSCTSWTETRTAMHRHAQQRLKWTCRRISDLTQRTLAASVQRSERSALYTLIPNAARALRYEAELQLPQELTQYNVSDSGRVWTPAPHMVAARKAKVQARAALQRIQATSPPAQRLQRRLQQQQHGAATGDPSASLSKHGRPLGSRSMENLRINRTSSATSLAGAALGPALSVAAVASTRADRAAPSPLRPISAQHTARPASSRPGTARDALLGLARPPSGLIPPLPSGEAAQPLPSQRSLSPVRASDALPQAEEEPEHSRSCSPPSCMNFPGGQREATSSRSPSPARHADSSVRGSAEAPPQDGVPPRPRSSPAARRVRRLDAGSAAQPTEAGALPVPVGALLRPSEASKQIEALYRTHKTYWTATTEVGTPERPRTSPVHRSPGPTESVMVAAPLAR